MPERHSDVPKRTISPSSFDETLLSWVTKIISSFGLTTLLDIFKSFPINDILLPYSLFNKNFRKVKLPKTKIKNKLDYIIFTF